LITYNIHSSGVRTLHFDRPLHHVNHPHQLKGAERVSAQKQRINREYWRFIKGKKAYRRALDVSFITPLFLFAYIIATSFSLNKKKSDRSRVKGGLLTSITIFG